MTLRDLLALLLLGAIWGASFLFMRIAAPEFGPIALIATRVTSAAVVLLIVLAARRRLTSLRKNVVALALLGAINTAIPFTMFAFTTLHVSAGYASVLNGTVPLFSALVAMLLGLERLPRMRILGLLVGFAGVVVLVLPKLKGRTDAWAVASGLGAAFLYGIAAHYSRKRFAGEDSLVVSTGSLIAASLILLPFALVTWPTQTLSLQAWSCALGLGLVCTAIAYVIYFRLLNRIGATRAVTVTYLVPVFGMMWGYLILSEQLTWNMLFGCAVILTGTALVVTSQQRKPTPKPAHELPAAASKH